LGDEELLKHGQRVFAELSPHFLLGQKGQGDMMQLMQRWTDFLEECQLRNVDMRRFSPVPPRGN